MIKDMAAVMKKRKGVSYAKRVADVNGIYDEMSKTGLSNREIRKRYIWPRFGMSERSFYNALKSSMREDLASQKELEGHGMVFETLLWPEEEIRDGSFFRKAED